jgi:hypothetical protein
MNELLLWLGRAAGVVGIVTCAAATLWRLTGAYWAGGFQVGTLLLGGTSLLAVGCFLLLVVATRHDRRER